MSKGRHGGSRAPGSRDARLALNRTVILGCRRTPLGNGKFR